MIQAIIYHRYVQDVTREIFLYLYDIESEI